MTQNQLTDLDILAIESKLSKTLNFDDIIAIFGYQRLQSISNVMASLNNIYIIYVFIELNRYY